MTGQSPPSRRKNALPASVTRPGRRRPWRGSFGAKEGGTAGPRRRRASSLRRRRNVRPERASSAMTTPEATRKGSRFRPMQAKVNLPALEHDVLERWKKRDVFNRSLAERADGPLWTFYEGPPTANGKPGTHHVEAR